MILPFTKPPVLFYQGNETLDKPSEKGDLKMGTENPSIKNLVERIQRDEIRLPEMQRGYVWPITKVRDLLDSLYRGYPSGTILTWQTDEKVTTRKFAVSQETPTYESFRLLLDGQQRLTSLCAVILGEPVQVRGRPKNIDILFNLEHPDELNYSGFDKENDGIDATKEDTETHSKNMTFMVATKKLKSNSYLVSVTEVLKSNSNKDFLKKAGVTGWEHPLYDKYNDRLDALRKIEEYKYNEHLLEREKTYEEVTEIFVRVNSLGTKLKGSDLALAQITAKWHGSLDIFEKFQKQCKKEGFSLELGIVVINLISFATKSSNSKTISRHGKKELEQAWNNSKKGFEDAISFLKNTIGINTTALLSSPYILIALAYFFHHHGENLTPQDTEKLRYWLLIANAKGHYSRGSIYTFLDQDLKDIRGKDKASAVLVKMVESLRKHFSLRPIEEADLANKDSRSAYFKTMFLAFHADGATDWNKKALKISFDHSGKQNKLQTHHIFPKNRLRGNHERQKINDICNLAFINAKTNQTIKDKKPSVYLPNIDTDALESQQVSTNKELWELDKYNDFLADRRKKVAERLNKFLNLNKTGSAAKPK